MNRVGHTRIVESKGRKDEDIAYAKAISESLKTNLNGYKRPISNVQSASMQATMDRDPSLDEQHWNRSLPEEWKGTTERDPLNTQDILAITSLRQSSKNTLGDFMEAGLSGVSSERRELAIQAFNYSPPADLTPQQIEKVKKLESLETVDQKIEKKKSLIERAKESVIVLFSSKKASVKRNSIGHVLHKASGGKDGDLNLNE